MPTDVTLTSDRRGEVELWLTSPMGTVSKLLSKRPFDLDVAGFHAWPFMSVHYWGELANGTWTLTIHSGNAVVSLHDWSLNLYGVSKPPPFHPSQNTPDSRNPLRDVHPISHLLEKQQRHQGPQKPLPPSTSQLPKSASKPPQSFETVNSKDAFKGVVENSRPSQSAYPANGDTFPTYQHAGHGWKGYFPDSHDPSQWFKEDLLKEVFHANNYRAYGGAYPHSERSGLGEPKRANGPADSGYYPNYESKTAAAAAEAEPHSKSQVYPNSIESGLGLPQLTPSQRLNTPPKKSAYGQGHPALLWQRMDLSTDSSTSSSAPLLSAAGVLAIFCICVTASLSLS
ncbi:hypothetical protein SprV_0100058600 [Sparganum proliferum]